jgi:hypothetical protein
MTLEGLNLIFAIYIIYIMFYMFTPYETTHKDIKLYYSKKQLFQI